MEGILEGQALYYAFLHASRHHRLKSCPHNVPQRPYRAWQHLSFAHTS